MKVYLRLFMAGLFKLAFGVTLISPNSFADIRIDDPQSLLTKADEFLGTPNFIQSFNLNHKATFTNYVNACEYQCENGGCVSQCEMSERQTITQVYTCSESNVTYGNDEGSLYLELSKEQFDSFHGNVARYVFLHLDEHFKVPGHLVLNKITLGKYKDELSNGSKEYDAMTLWGDYVLENGQGGFSTIVTIGKNIPSIAQILRLRVADQTIYRLKGIP